MKIIRRGRIIGSFLFLLLIAFSVFLGLMPAKAEPLDTYHSSWHLIRETAVEDGATFEAVYARASAWNFANKDSSNVLNGGPFRITSKNTQDRNEGFSAGAAWDFVISGGDLANETFSWSLVGWAKTNGMLQIIAEGTGIIGTVAVVLYPDDSATATNIFWADTLVITDATYWNTVSVLNSGNDNVAVLHVDMAGLEWAQMIIYNANGTAPEANLITVFGKRY